MKIKKKCYKITVVGTGYVGISLATLLSQNNMVIAYDIQKDKCDKINNREPLMIDAELETLLKNKNINLIATTDYIKAFSEAEYIIICVGTDYDTEKNFFDTSNIEDIIEKVIAMNISPTIIIKSTIPVGYTESIKKKYGLDNIIYSPEFLRESKGLFDNLYPSRIIVGEESIRAKLFAELLRDVALSQSVEIKYMSNTEAEAIKLFSNTYLALRVAYFNELDTYAELKGLNTKNIIDGVCLDPRIGNYYNNPSFGYGGYCLPKDTKQLLANFSDVPENLIEAIVNSNETRKDHITEMILVKKPKIVGIYRLTMKSNSDNFRNSAIKGIIDRLKKHKVEIVIYEPTLDETKYNDCEVCYDFNFFIKKSDVILANRFENQLNSVKEKVYTRDIFSRD